MNTSRVFIAGLGLISPLGRGQAATLAALRDNSCAIRPLELFPLLKGETLPVGQTELAEDAAATTPRTHRLALLAAREAMAGQHAPPDAIVLGTTTGGILTSEHLLRSGDMRPEAYRRHGLTTVAEFLAQELSCHGPCLTVSTACSSGALAIAIARRMLQAGLARRVLAGGADALCRLTYFGFHSLQLVDRGGCHPLDRDRQGMAVAEGAALLLLTSERLPWPLAEVAGMGLSCDAHHAAAPHPEGDGACRAMQAALADAGLPPAAIDYINLHGTGTPENDLAEAKAIRRLFAVPPPLSSVKGASGHSLAAAGAIEAGVAALAIGHGLLPANTGLRSSDPALGLAPLDTPRDAPVTAVLSNSFGFGGNNAALVLTAPGLAALPPATAKAQAQEFFAVHGTACLSGAGDTATTLERLAHGESVAGQAEATVLEKNLPPRLIRRLQRLPRLALALASAVSGIPRAIFFGSGWGGQTETWNFLTRLNESEEQFPSPTDFVGSVHNAPAGQVAMHLGATGANVTCSGGDASFAQALFCAALLVDDTADPVLVLGADEGHPRFTPLLEPSLRAAGPLSDGGGALLLSRRREGARCLVSRPRFLPHDTELTDVTELTALTAGCAVILAGLPAADRERDEARLGRLLAALSRPLPLIRYRAYTGEFASASALAAVLAVSWLRAGHIPGPLLDGPDLPLTGSTARILLLDLGKMPNATLFVLP